MIEKIVISNGTNTTFGALTWLRSNPVTTPTGFQASYVIANVSGLGMPKAEVNVTNYANVGGGFYNGSRLETRNITFDIYFPNVGAAKNSDLRIAITNYLSCGKPLDVGIYIDGTSSYYKYATTAYLEECTGDVFGSNLDLTTLHVSLICPDPYFYTGPTQKPVTLTADNPFSQASIWIPYSYNVSSAVISGKYYSIAIPSAGLNMNNDLFAEIIDVSTQERILGVYFNVPGGIPNMELCFDPTKKRCVLNNGGTLPLGAKMVFGYFNGTSFEKDDTLQPLIRPIEISKAEIQKQYILRTQLGLYSEDQRSIITTYSFDGRKELCAE